MLEGVQRSFTKRLPGFANLPYSERLSKLSLQSLEHRRFLFDLVICFNIVHGHTALRFNDFFSFSKATSTRGHQFKLCIPLDKSNLHKFFFSSRQGSHRPGQIKFQDISRTFQDISRTFSRTYLT